MPTKLMEVLKLAANWMKIEGVEAVSANDDIECLVVFVSVKFNRNTSKIPETFNGVKVSIILQDS